MTRKTGIAFVLIARLFIVIVIRLVLITVRMASKTGEDAVVRLIRVTVETITPLVPVLSGIDGKVHSVVIECRPEPTVRIVALAAVGREACRTMIGIGGRVPVSLVARVAVGRCTRVDTADVALRAGQTTMT